MFSLSLFPFLFQEKSTVEDIHKEVCVALVETFFCPSVIVCSLKKKDHSLIIYSCKLVLVLEIRYLNQNMFEYVLEQHFKYL